MKIEQDTLKHPFDLPAIVFVVALDLSEPKDPKLASSDWKKNRRTALSEARRSMRHEVNHGALKHLSETGGAIKGISIMTDGSLRLLFGEVFGPVEVDPQDVTKLELDLINDWINTGGSTIMKHKAEKLERARIEADKLDDLE